MAAKRIQREIIEAARYTPSIIVEPIDGDVFNCRARVVVSGIEDLCICSIRFPSDYPFKAPMITHSLTGLHFVLGSAWSSSLTVGKVSKTEYYFRYCYLCSSSDFVLLIGVCQCFRSVPSYIRSAGAA
jgi:hypothetical protein